jgi:diguanylate cyclase (GGDEF)-like protein
MHRLYELLIIFITTSSFTGLSFAGPKVLLLNSYHAQYQWTQANNKGIKQVLSSEISDEDLFIEFMDSRRFLDNDTHKQALLNFYRSKYQRVQPDIIISTDDLALDFLIQYRDEIFPHTPVVFNGVNFDPTQKLVGLNNFVGIQESDAIAENLELITQLHKGQIDEIIVLSDKSSLGLLFSEEVLALKEGWRHPNIEITLQDDFSFEGLLYQVNNSSPNESKGRGKAYFITALHKDNQGRYFSFSHDIPTLTRYSKSPMYGMWGTPLLGLGIVGGYMNNPVLHGQNTARIALDILSGKDIESIDKNMTAQFLPRFDKRQLDKFKIELNTLPLASEINFEQQTLFSRFKNAILIIIGIIITLVIIIILLSAQVRRRKQAENELADANNDLENNIVQRTLALESSNRALLKLNSRMESLANTDDLTLIPNRRHGHRILDRLNYIEGEEYCVALIDIDHFKSVNDRHGHDVGDKILQFISHTINQFIRPGDTICRWGGEEFLLIMPATQNAQAFIACERVRNLIATTPIAPIKSITISVGISSKNKAETISELLRQADLALYQAKDKGRNLCIIWQPDSEPLERPAD